MSQKYLSVSKIDVTLTEMNNRAICRGIYDQSSQTEKRCRASSYITNGPQAIQGLISSCTKKGRRLISPHK